MEVKIESKKENKLFARTEIVARTDGTGATAARPKIREAIAKEMGVQADAVHIKLVKPGYGNSTNMVVAEVYKSKDELEKTVKPKLRMREQPKKGKKEGS